MGYTRDGVECKVRTQGNTLGDEPSAECGGDMGDLISMVFMRRRSGHKLLAGAADLSCREAYAQAVPLWQGDLIFDDEQLPASKVQ